MNNELLAILDYIEQERGISKDQIIDALEKALLTASRKSIHPASDLTVKVLRDTGEIKAWAKLEVVEAFPNDNQIRLDDAVKQVPDAKIGDIITWEVTPRNFGRIAAKTAQQALQQQFRKAEKEIVQDEFKDKVGQILSGTVHHIESGSIVVSFQKAEGIISLKDRIPGEQFSVGDRLHALLLKVDVESAGPSLILSRSHANFVRKLFEREVSEIHDGIVEIVAVAREAGSRSKIAVRSSDPRVDPVGACVGMRGMRVKNISNELGGERIDIIHYEENLRDYLANAMHPAKLKKIEIDEAKAQISVYVDSENTRLAFGKKAQNVRLAQKLLRWSINIVTDDRSEEEAFEAKKADAIRELAGILAIAPEDASVLVNNGYLTIEGLREIPRGEIHAIPGLSQEAADAVAKAVESGSDSINPTDDAQD